MEDAVQAARRIIAVDEGAPDAGEDFEYLDIITVARAYLSSRPSIIEECAKVAEEFIQLRAEDLSEPDIADDYVRGMHDGAIAVLSYIRSLKEKDGQ